MKCWKKLSQEEIRDVIFNALKKNVNYRNHPVLGIPGSYLDSEIFYEDLPLLKEAPFLSALIANPNHIGCHTLPQSETLFAGTQQIEKEVVGICAVDILKADEDTIDGYIASGGTEANIEAVWIYRNYFRNEYGSKSGDTALFYSEDSHYSFPKAADILCLPEYVMPVDQKTREIRLDELQNSIDDAKRNGIKSFIIILNCGTTMFGSVDNPKEIVSLLLSNNLNFKLHIDGAFGGFIHPFTTADSQLTFQNPYISSFTLDAHKMLQAPFGTGIFLVRKNHIHNVCTDAAQYVHGKDHTLCGSRSGANAIAVWMLLQNYGPQRWKEKMQLLNKRTRIIGDALSELSIPYFHQEGMNIITIPSGTLPVETARKFSLVADTWNDQPKWWKIVVMDHVTEDYIHEFIRDLELKVRPHLKKNIG